MSQDNSNGLKTPLGWAMANGDPSGDQTCQSSLNDAENGTTICGGVPGHVFCAGNGHQIRIAPPRALFRLLLCRKHGRHRDALASQSNECWAAGDTRHAVSV